MVISVKAPVTVGMVGKVVSIYDHEVGRVSGKSDMYWLHYTLMSHEFHHFANMT